MSGSSKADLWTSQEVATALALTDVLPFWKATGISIDTRTLQIGDLYIAIRGDTYDGHAFVREAFAKGAVAALVDHLGEGHEHFPQVVVEDTLKALTRLGDFARTRTKATIIAVTGSVGKTSSKELLRHALEIFGSTFASPASYNNHWGVPVSLASMPRDTVYGVFEVGTNHRGEIEPLASLARPHISVITAITEAHIGHMVSREVIAEEKSDIFKGVPAPGLAIINQDAPEFAFMKQRALACGVSKVMGFGKSSEAAVQLTAYGLDSQSRKSLVTASVNGHKVTYTLPQLGEHVAVNSLIALAIGEALGLDQKQLVQRLETLPAVKGRGQQHRIPITGGEILLIDDAYNANLTSMEAGLSVLAATPIPSGGRRITVLGEMLELGAHADAHHHQLMRAVLAHAIDLVFATGGPVMENAFTQYIPVKNAGGYVPCVDILVSKVMDTLRPGDVVFVKGSKGSQVSKIVDALLTRKKTEREDG